MDLWAAHDLAPDAAEVEASRRFHIEYWLGVAESAIAADHRNTCYESLTPNIRELVDSVPDPLYAEKDLIATLRSGLAFLEGHVRAYRDILNALKEIAARDKSQSAQARHDEPRPKAQDCGSRAA